MAVTTGLGDGLLVSGYDVSGDVGSIGSIQQTWGDQDMTALPMYAMDRRQLIENGVIGFNNFFDDSDGGGAEARGIHDILTAVSPGARYAHRLTYSHGRSVGSWVANIEAMLFNYALARQSTGSLLGTVNCSSTGGGERAIEWARSLTAFVESAASVHAAGSLHITGTAVATDTLEVGATTYTFVASGATAGQINIGANVAGTIANIVAALNGTDSINSANASVTAVAASGNRVAVTAIALGAAAFTVPTVYTNSGVGTNAFDAATLTGTYGFTYAAHHFTGITHVRGFAHVLAFAGTDAAIKLQHSANGSTGWADLVTLWQSGVDAAAPSAVVKDYTGGDANDYLRIGVTSTAGFTALRFAASARAL